MDVGLEALSNIHSRLMIDEPWAIREARAFSWIGHRLLQRVEASPVFESRGISISRIVSSTTVVEDVGVTEQEAEGVLADLNFFAVGSAYVYSPIDRSVSVMLAHNVHTETVTGRSEEIAGYQVIALVHAERWAERLAERLKGSVARRQHPTSGERVVRTRRLIPERRLASLPPLAGYRRRCPTH